MPLNYTPLSWKNVDPSDPRQMRLFLLQLSDFLNVAFNAPFLSAALNGSHLIQGSAIANNTVSISNLKPVVSVNNPQVGNLTVACDGATSVWVNVVWTSTTSTAISLTHLGFGVPVLILIVNAATGAQAYSINATDPGGTAYSEVGTTFASAATGAAFTSLTGATNLTNGNRIIYSGMSGGATGNGGLYFAA